MPTRGRLVFSSRDPGAAQQKKRVKRPEAPRDQAASPSFQGDTVYVERSRKGRGGKTVTIVWNAPGDDHAKRALLKELKAACGAGGTLKDGALEIQGDQRDRLVAVLKARNITVKARGG